MRKPIIAIIAVGAALMLTACSTTAGPQLAVMDEGGNAQLPDWVENPEGIPTIDLTLIGEYDDMTVYASRNDDDEWCVIAALAPLASENDWVVSTACGPAIYFGINGAEIRGGSSTRSGGALLLPDGYTGTIEDGWVRINDNLAVWE
ncbi:hypothetical protein [Rhodoglobus aureus]|uniref:Lipoprotein n=1 Tax=Rhodoglobus aureus TaxID=191497 RepID=A0ABN1VS74_9MICO